MTNPKSAITILTCQDEGKKAVKTFSKKADGSIEKKSYGAGTYFTYEEIHFSDIKGLANILESLSIEPRKFAIRGKIKKNMPRVVRRKIHAPEAAFDPEIRPYVMLDIDKQPCPDYFDCSERPEEVIAWVLSMLPSIFHDTTCYYRFSSSQDVYPKVKGKNMASVHLWFYCNRDVSDQEWKSLFQSLSAPVDQALFSPVQIHYTANPIFENMEDPLPKRSGIFKGKHDEVIVPIIPEAESRKSIKRSEREVFADKKSCDDALALLSSYYSEGSRNRLCGAIAGALYRGGWNAENVAIFVHELAERCSDEDSDGRYNTALKICDAIEHDLPAQGIPTLKNEFGIKELDKILGLLGLGKPDMALIISKLNNQSTIPEIKESLKALLALSEAERIFYLEEMSEQTQCKIGQLKALFKEVEIEEAGAFSCDNADLLMEILLNEDYKGGQYLLHTADKSYWQYNGRFWEMIPIQQIKKALLPHARKFIAELDEGSLPTFNNSVLNILEGRTYAEGDPLRQTSKEPVPVINCQNGELWFDENGDYTLKPHRVDSYLRSCLEVSYDPAAKSPLFDAAVLEIFSNSSHPEDMFRHFMELTGYILQPWRKLAIIPLFHGGGSNGKTSLVQIIRQMLGKNTVMSDRISDIESNVFKIGDLDGKLLLLDDDVDGGTCIPDGFLKKISEEKAMTGQHKHKPPFEFICRAVPIMLANDYPVTSDLSHGLRRRLMVIPFARTFLPQEMKVGLFKIIWEQEAPGILNHAILGFQRLKNRGGFSEPQDCIDAKNEWIVRANILTTYIQEECELGENYREHLGDFYTAFAEYCSSTGIRNVQTRKGVEQRLEALGYRIGQLGGKKAVWGLRLSLSEHNKADLKIKM